MTLRNRLTLYRLRRLAFKRQRTLNRDASRLAKRDARTAQLRRMGVAK